LLGDTEQLNKALDMMNNAVAGGHSQPGARENVAYLASTERRRDFESLPAGPLSGHEVNVRIIVQINLAKGCIAVLSPLMAVNAFVHLPAMAGKQCTHA